MAWQRHVVSVQQVNSRQQSGSEQAQLLRQSLADTQQEIAIRMAVAERDTSGNYTSRGLNQLDEIRPLREEARALVHQLAQLQNTGAVTGADSGSVQAIITGSGRLTRLLVFAVIALLIDGVALLSFARAGRCSWRTPTGDTTSDSPRFTDPVAQIKSRVLSGELGEQPSQRQLLDEVKTAFRELADSGQIAKTGPVF